MRLRKYICKLFYIFVISAFFFGQFQFVDNANAWTNQFSAVSILKGPDSSGTCSTNCQYVNSIQYSSSNFIYVAGGFSGTIDIDPGAGTTILSGTSAAFLAKYDRFGELIWGYGIGNYTGSTPIITLDSAENIYLTGKFSGTNDFDPSTNIANLSSSGMDDIFIGKYNSDGGFVWAKKIGGAGADNSTSIAVDQNNSVYISGSFDYTVDFDPGSGISNLVSDVNGDGYVLKLDVNGSFIWAKSFAGGLRDYVASIFVNSSNGIYFLSLIENGSGTFKSYLYKYSSAGLEIWKVRIGNNTAESQFGRHVVEMPDGKVLTLGHFSGTVDFDPGAATYNLSATGRDAFLLNLNSDGTFVWAKRFDCASAPSGCSMNDLKVSQDSNIFLAGSFSTSLGGVIGLVSSDVDAFIAKLDQNGNLIWARQIGGTGSSQGLRITLSPLEETWMVGDFGPNSDFDTSSLTNTISSEGGTDGYILRTNSLGSSNLDSTITPTFSNYLAKTNGYEVSLDNYDEKNSYKFTNDLGSLATTILDPSTIKLGVSGLSPGQTSTITISTSRYNYATSITNYQGAAQDGPFLTPTFSTPVATATGFTVNVTNYNSAYTFTPTVNSGSVTPGVASGSTLPLTVSGLAPGASATVTVTITRTGYATGSAGVSSIALLAALTPTFSTPIRTATGFTVNVTNYNSAYTFTPTVNSGSVTPGVASGSTLPLTVSGLAPGASATVTVTITRTGYATGSAGVSSIALLAALTPTFSTPIRTATGFTVNVTNYNSAYTFTPTVNSGSVTPGVASGSTLPLTVSGLAPGASATVTVTIKRTGYATGSAGVSSSAQTGTALIPTFSTATPTADGFTLQISNYDSAFTWAGTNSLSATTTISNTGLITVSALAPGTSSTVTITTTRTGYNQGSATSSSIASITGTALIPTFSTATPTADGFTLQISNYDSAFTWAGTNSLSATTTISNTGLITVSALAPGTSSTVTITTTRTGYNQGSATSSSIASITGTALIPTFSTATPTADGFTLQISNYDSAFTWAGTNSLSATTTISNTGLITVSALAPGTSSTVTITTTRTGYNQGSATSSSIASITGTALIPTFSTATPTADGFTLQISNYDSAFTWAGTNSLSATTTISNTGLITVSALAPGTSSTVTITTTRTGYNQGSATSSSIASITGAALNPTFSTPVATATGFSVSITNFDPAFTWATPTVSAGSVAITSTSGAIRVLTVTALSAGASATITQTTSRTGYAGGSNTVTGSAIALPAGLTPTFSTPASTSTGFTVNVTNYNSAYTFTPAISAGTVTKGKISGTTLPLTVTGLSAGQSATITMTVTRTGYTTGSATVTGSATLGAALTPTLSTPVATTTGFTVNVTNYNSAFTFTPTITSGGATVTAGTASGTTLPLTISGVNFVGATVKVATSRTNYASASASVSANALPTITTLSQTTAPIGTAITITGTNLWGATSVKVGTSTKAITKFTVISSTQIIINTAAAATGALTVVTPGGTATGPSMTISSTLTVPGAVTLSATTGGPGSAITLTGVNLGSATSVTRGATSIPFKVIANNQILLAIPTALTTGTFSVTTPGGSVTSATFTASSTLALPTVTSSAQNTARGTLVTLTGNNLGAITSMTLNGAAFTDYVVTSPGTIVLRIPSTATVGSATIVVTTAGGSVTTLTVSIA